MRHGSQALIRRSLTCSRANRLSLSRGPVVPESPGDDIARAALYGAILPGTFTPAALKQARESGPRLDPNPQARFDPVVQQMCDEVFAAAPAFVCCGRLDGAAAEFADYFAIAMLRERNASLD
jgi:hypothetical protein